LILLTHIHLNVIRSLKAVHETVRAAGSPIADFKYLTELDNTVMAGRRALQACWPNDFNTVNFLTGRHYRECAEKYGNIASLNVCMEEMMHGTFKSKLSTTSGRHSVVELMQHENFRQASRYYHRVLANLETAGKDPEVAKLPEAIRADLLNPSSKYDALRASLRPRSTKTPYTNENSEVGDVLDLLRTGREEKMLFPLSALDQLLLGALSSGSQDAVLVQVPNAINTVPFLTLPGHHKKMASIWSPSGSKGESHYAVDAPVGDARHKGIFQVVKLFVFKDIGYAYGMWGAKKGVDALTSCQGYHFEAPAESGAARILAQARRNPRTILQTRHERIVRACRLVDYVHFGITARGQLFLDKFYIPHWSWEAARATLVPGHGQQ
jgi:hypothetical protein